MRKHLLVSAVLAFILVSIASFQSFGLRVVRYDTSVDGALQLPTPKTSGTMSVEEAIAKRRSVRSYLDEPLTLGEVSQILWAAQGITDPTGKRAAPSAGATYPLEIFVVVGKDRVAGLDSGVFHYVPEDHMLVKAVDGDVRPKLEEAALGQRWVGQAPIVVVVTAIYERTTGRYGDRGVRYVHMEVGHVGQNIYLEATALGLGTVVIGAFDDDQVKRVLELPSDHEPLYIIPVGRIAGASPEPQTTTSTSAPEPGKGCLIATATYGSELQHEAQSLRLFRDREVKSTFAGKEFMSLFDMWYYSFSPQVAEFISFNPTAKMALRILLHPLVAILNLSSIISQLFRSNPEVGITLSGLFASALIGVVYFSPFAATMMFLRRRVKVQLLQLWPILCMWVVSAVSMLLGEITRSSLLVGIGSVGLVVSTILLFSVVTPFCAFMLAAWWKKNHKSMQDWWKSVRRV